MPRHNVQIRMGHTSLGHKIDSYFAGLGLGFNPDKLRRDRLAQIIVLEAASDAELADMGLDRADILPHVFRDILN